MIEYELVRSKRKTLAVQVTREGRVIVRAPLRLAKYRIERFVAEHTDWIVRALADQQFRRAAHPEPDEAKQAVLRARAALPVQLLCAVPFDGQADRFPLEWKRRFNRCLLAADKVYALSRSYHAGCFAARNRFMVDASSRLICYYDGRSGGTAQTVHMAEQSGLKIVNLADGQLSLL